MSIPAAIKFEHDTSILSPMFAAEFSSKEKRKAENADVAGASTVSQSSKKPRKTAMPREETQQRIVEHVPEVLQMQVVASTQQLIAALEAYNKENGTSTLDEALRMLVPQYNIYTAPGKRGKHSKQICGAILAIDVFIKSVKNLLSKRIGRVQMQAPLNGKSVLAFPTQTCNQALWSALCHPKNGAEGYRTEISDKGPWSFPRLSDLKSAKNLSTFNSTVKKIHSYFHSGANEAGGTGESGGARRKWVNARREYLQDHATLFGLDRPFQPSKYIIPNVPDGHVLLWNAYHQTTDSPYNQDGTKMKHAKGLFETAIVDAAPKRIMPDEAWNLLYKINRVCMTDIGEGAEWSRHGKHWIEFCEHTGKPAGLPIEALEPWARRFFDPLAERRELEEPASSVPLSAEHVEAFLRHGYVVSSEPMERNLREMLKNTFEQHRQFAQYVLFERDGLTQHGRRILLTDSLFEDILTKPGQAASRLTGNKSALYLFDCAQCSRFPKAPKSGLGPSASCYGIPEFLQFQAHCGLALETFYGEPCMLIPERLRVKAGTKWGLLHSDRRLAP